MKETKLISFFKKHYIYLLAFFVPVVIMLIIFAGQGVFPFGNKSFLHLDMYHQYYPFLVEFFHKLKSGESLLYSWNLGSGASFLALYVYYLASPFNWLCIFVPEAFLLEFMTYLVVFRIGLCGFTFAFYLRRHFGVKNFAIVLFSVFYALSGYMAAYNWNVMWLDCIVLAPLIILGLERLVNEGKPKFYCIMLALAILSNYYICIMICIYLVLYFIVLFISAPKKGRAVVQFAFYSLLAGGMAAVLLLPELAALSLTEFSNSDFPKTMTSYFSIFDVLARHFADVKVETMLDHWPNLYCGVAVMIFLPLYFISKNVSFREKIAKLVLLAFLIVSFSTNTLTFIWHGLNYPDSLPCRQSFLYIILLLTVCFEAFLHLREYTKKEITTIYFGVLFFVVLAQKIVTDDAFTTASFYITAVILILYGIFINLYMNHAHLTKRLTFLALVLVMVEAGINTGLTSVPVVSRDSYMKDLNSYREITAKCKNEDQDFYRIEKFKRLTQNDAMLAGFPSATCFSSTNTALLTGFYDSFGMQNSRVYYSFQGATPLTSALLSVKYMLANEERPDNPLYTKIDTVGNISLYENKYTLPFGYVVNPNYLNHDESITDMLTSEDNVDEIIENEGDNPSRRLMNPLAAQNSFASSFTSEGKLFDRLKVKDAAETSASIAIEQTGHIYAYVENHKVPSVTVYSKNFQQEFKKLKNPYILDLGYQKAGTILEITSSNEETLKLTAYQLNETVLQNVLSELSAQPMTVNSYDSTKLSGHITVSTDGQLVLSAPYEPGWKVFVDGKEAEISLFENCMISVPVTKGDHEIRMTYYPDGLKIGIAVSVFSFLLFALLARKKAQKPELPISEPLQASDV